MKFLNTALSLICLTFFSTPSFAGEEIIGATVERNHHAYELENIVYKTTLLLDAKIFNSHQLERLNWDQSVETATSYARVQVRRKQTRVREGLLIEIEVEGPAFRVQKFFDGVLSNISSATETMGGWVWNLPSDEYKRHWSRIYISTQKDIKYQAFIKWFSRLTPEEKTSVKTCELHLV